MFGKRVESCYNVAELRKMASRRLPSPMFHYIDGLALGARACSSGRPCLLGLGAGSEAGVRQALEILRTELERNMALLGCRRIADIDESLVRKVSARWSI